MKKICLFLALCIFSINCVQAADSCSDGKKLVNGKCVRNIQKCISWQSEHICKTCEKGFHLEWYGSGARICYPDMATAIVVCKQKKPSCSHVNPSGWAADNSSGLPWVDCGSDQDNAWFFIYKNGSWVPNGKKGNPGC